MLRPARPPFAGCRRVQAVVPTPDDRLDADEAAVLERLPRQLATESDALARELGAPVVVVPAEQPRGPLDGRWLLGPRSHNPALADLGLPTFDVPTHHLDRAARRLVSDAPDVAGLLQTFTGLRSLARHGSGALEVTDVHTLDEAVERVLVEVHDAWAGRHVRDVDWPAASRRFVYGVRGAQDPVRALQRWLATLGDFHTWVRPVRTQLVLPYGGWVHGREVVLTSVLPWTKAASLGVGPGWRLQGLDPRAMAETTPAAPHARSLLVARRLLSGDPGETRALEARGPGGATARWEETLMPPTGTPAAWEVLPSGIGFLWIGAWVPGLGVEQVIAEAFEELPKRCDRLIVDLRGNSGGRLAMAESFRARFVDAPLRAGWIRTTEPGGRLGPFAPIDVTPHEGPRWTRPVRFLTSPLTYSSSEDALLGLRGLPHVQVWGESSGGGSGRLRRMRLLPGWRLTISTALTWDRHGRLVEGQGLGVDHPVAPDRVHPSGRDEVFLAAEGTPW